MPLGAPLLHRERQQNGGIRESESQASQIHGNTMRRHGKYLAHHTNG